VVSPFLLAAMMQHAFICSFNHWYRQLWSIGVHAPSRLASVLFVRFGTEATYHIPYVRLRAQACNFVTVYCVHFETLLYVTIKIFACSFAPHRISQILVTPLASTTVHGQMIVTLKAGLYCYQVPSSTAV